jgi:hypothetical protein
LEQQVALWDASQFVLRVLPTLATVRELVGATWGVQLGGRRYDLKYLDEGDRFPLRTETDWTTACEVAAGLPSSQVRA